MHELRADADGTVPAPARDRTDKVLASVLIVVLSAASLLAVNQYAFGVADQWSTLPLLNYDVDAELYPHDYLRKAWDGYFSLLWPVIAYLKRMLDLDVPVLLLCCQVLCVVAAFYAFYRIATVLCADRRAVYLSLFLLLFLTKTPLTYDALLDRVFTTRMMALPLLLLCIDQVLRRRYLLAAACLGVAFLIHPMTAVHLLAILVLPVVWTARRKDAPKLGVGILLFAALTSPMLVWKLGASSSWQAWSAVSQEWLRILRYREPGMAFPFSWALNEYFRFLALLVAFGVSMLRPPTTRYHRIILLAVASVFGLLICGTVFVEVVPVRIVVQLQLGRSTRFLLLFAIVYFANAWVEEMKADTSLMRKLLITSAGLGLFYGGARTGWGLLFLGFVAVALAVMGAVAWTQSMPHRSPFVAMLLVVAAAMSSGIWAIAYDGSWPRMRDATVDVWLDLQQWAREHTSVQDTFIVPPFLPGFRYHSERSTFAEWKDGTMAFWDEDVAREWDRRMAYLNLDPNETDRASRIQDYKDLTESDFRDIAAYLAEVPGNVYVIVVNERQRMYFQEVYRNRKYRVYRIPFMPQPLKRGLL